MGGRGRIFGRVTAVALVASAVLTAPALADTHGTRALIRYTEHGIPHISAKSFDGLGYGYGFAAAKDNLCELANGYLTVDAKRSKYLGPGGSGNSALSGADSNLASDVHFQRINDSGVVESLLHQPRREVKEIVGGYVDGYNKYLKEHGTQDPACRDAGWVRPITDIDVYRHLYAIAGISGQGELVNGLVGAQPSGGVLPEDAAARISTALAEEGTIGSNGIAVGKAGTAAEQDSVLLGNPHFPWQGGRRFWQAQLTIPGRFNASGASLLGMPLIQIGHTRDTAWTHTFSTARTFGLFEVKLTPGDQLSYVVDGQPEKMSAQKVSVEVKQPDGSLATDTRTLYSTRYGPVITGVGDIPLPWTTTSAYTLRDGNATNLRALNSWFDLNQAQDVEDISKALKSTLGVPWVNTIATDRHGKALYSDVQVVPHVTDELADRCSTPLGRQLFQAAQVSVLDGSQGTCAWGSDADAVEPGLLGPGRLPHQIRDDYELNANDSPWLANAGAPLTGYPWIVGDTGTTRSPRTREALISTEEQLGEFTTASMKELLFGDRSRLALLAADAAAEVCGTGPACDALRSWDRTYTLESRGSLLFERFAMRLGPGPIWKVGFDPADPLHTPNTLDTQNPVVRKAFDDAVAELTAAGIPLDAKLGDHQSVTRNGKRIPMHSGPGQLGILNAMAPVWDPKAGNVDFVHGSSFIQVVGLSGKACPDTSTLMTYSQSADPTSPHFADQTELYSRGEWVRGRFCEGDILSSPELRIVALR
ncbi:penicillin acylase family protein [Amycolatopsis sp. YIM 10]|uniref:penicillin acylase family protein n=1 Tax=Amycolatopsis sp. YIM 10 TaxID=2653857 RepID=UPI00129081D4|nr:penicillin acylase family protein [Amycolatopsis sp. YIM 10]QFU92888.1 Aculeacin-A acylase precursor [Amycolatopsis sp. YIM 10]